MAEIPQDVIDAFAAMPDERVARCTKGCDPLPFGSWLRKHICVRGHEVGK